MELLQNLWQAFTCIVVLLYSIRKTNFLPEMELLQNLWQTFACVALEKQTFYQKWSCFKIYGKLLPV
jgi:hypothetical protein